MALALLRLTGAARCGTAVGLALLALGGCSAIMSSATGGLSRSLAAGLRDQADPEIVRQGAPAYLIMVDGLILDHPRDAGLLAAGAALYSTYAGAFVDDPERLASLTETGRSYGLRALCVVAPGTCGASGQPYERFEQEIGRLRVKHVEELFQAGASWGTWIQARRSDWSAIADKARVEAMMRRVVELDPGYGEGSPHLYLGVLATLIPEALGGRPEDGRRHFERAIELSGGRDQMAKVLLAREYARMVFDRELHDRLCREVLDADPRAPGLTLANVLAQREARILLDDSEGYFGD